jgi:DNA repair exonuclease SbcCD nuclease subunit
VAGNHDAASRITKTLRLPENVYVFAHERPDTQVIEHLQVAIHGQSFSSPAIFEDLSQQFPGPLTGYYNIGLLHTSAHGREGHEPYAPCSVDALKMKGYQYWALGHIHGHEILSHSPPVVFSGNPQGRHVRETGPKGCMLVTVDDHFDIEMVFRPVDVVRWAIADVDANGVESGFELVERCRLSIKTLHGQEGMPMAVRCRISGTAATCDDILSDIERWTNEIRAAVTEIENGSVWLEKVQFNLTRPVLGQSFKGISGPIDELLDVLDALGGDAELLHEVALELLEVHKKLPRELREGSSAIKLDDTEWLKALLLEVQALLVTRLQHKREGL